MNPLIETARIAQDQNRQQLYSRESNAKVANEAARQIKEKQNDRKSKPRKIKNDKWKGAIPEYEIRTSLPRRRLNYGGYLMEPDNGFTIKTKNLNKYSYDPVFRSPNAFPFLFQGKNSYIIPGDRESVYNEIVGDDNNFFSGKARDAGLSSLPSHQGVGFFFATKGDYFKINKHTFEAQVFLPDPANLQRQITYTEVLDGDIVTLITNNRLALSIRISFDDMFIFINFTYILNSVGSFNYVANFTATRCFFNENNEVSGVFTLGGVVAIESAVYATFEPIPRLEFDYRGLGDIGPKISPGKHDIAICQNEDNLFLFIDGKMTSLFVLNAAEYVDPYYILTKRLELPSPIAIDKDSFESYGSESGNTVLLNNGQITIGSKFKSSPGFTMSAISVAYADEFSADLIVSPLNKIGFKNVRHIFGKCLHTKDYTPAESINNFT